MPTLELEFEVYCSCGNGLCTNSREGKNGHSQYITVEPCEKCMDRAEDKGYEKGFDKGWDDAKEKYE